MAPPHVVTVPAPVAPAPPAGSADITTRPGAVLAVSEGQALAARVVSAGGGEVELAVAGGRVRATTGLALEPGQTLRLLVASAGPDRVVLRPDPGASATQDPLAGLPRGAAGTLAATVGQEGLRPGIAADARAAGVATPAAAAAFGRLAAAGLPTGQAAVAGLAQLVDGPPIGASLAALLDSLPDGAPARGATATPGVPAPPAPPGPSPAATADPAGAELPPPPGTARGTVPAPAAAGGAVPVPGPAATGTPPAAAAAAGHAEAPLPTGTGAPAPAAAAAFGPVDPQAIEILRRLVAVITARTVSGHGEQVAQAAADLGRGLEAQLSRGGGAEAAPALRSTLLAIADDPGVAPAVARHAADMADAIGAQGLAAALPRAGDDATPLTPAAYLQLPLPGGDSVEVRVSPDGSGPGAQREGGTRRLAFLLHLSALGPVLIDAVVGPMGAEATIRAQSPEAAAFLARRGEELAQGLREAGLAPRAHVRVERGAAVIPQRLVDGPPSSGLDIVA